MSSKICHLCGRGSFLDDFYDGKPVHELCKLRKLAFVHQDEIERLREIIRKIKLY